MFGFPDFDDSHLLALDGSRVMTGANGGLRVGPNHVVNGPMINNIIGGNDNTVQSIADNNLVVGFSNVVNGHENLVAGNDNTATGHTNVVVGSTNNVQASEGSFVGGVQNTVGSSSRRSIIQGILNDIDCFECLVVGSVNSMLSGSDVNLLASGCTITGASASTFLGLAHTFGPTNKTLIAGEGHTGQGDYNAIFGLTNNTNSDHNLIAGSNQSVTQGSGLGGNVVGGRDHVLNGFENAVFGALNTLNNSNGLISGRENTINTSQGLCAGFANTDLGSGFQNYIFGNNHSITGNTHTTLVSGQINTVDASNTGLCIGSSNNLNGGNYIIGLANITQPTSSRCVLLGEFNDVDGLIHYALGRLGVISGGGFAHVVIGIANTIVSSGQEVMEIGARNNVVATVGNAAASMFVGFDNDADLPVDNDEFMGFGRWQDITHDNVIVIGKGTDNANRLASVAANQMILGMDSTTPQQTFDATGVGWFNTAPAAQQNVTGSRGGNAALASLLTAMANFGLITDNTTA